MVRGADGCRWCGSMMTFLSYFFIYLLMSLCDYTNKYIVHLIVISVFKISVHIYSYDKEFTYVPIRLIIRYCDSVLYSKETVIPLYVL